MCDLENWRSTSANNFFLGDHWGYFWGYKNNKLAVDHSITDGYLVNMTDALSANFFS
jgi:hypothetical protein